MFNNYYAYYATALAYYSSFKDDLLFTHIRDYDHAMYRMISDYPSIES